MSRRLLGALGCIILSSAVAGCTYRSPWNLQIKGRLNHAAIRESSGVAVSRQFKNILWTHNDAHNPPHLFAVDDEGKLIRSYYVRGAENNDWEDLALDERNNLYILDNTSRTDPQHRNFIYVLPEPNPFQDEFISEEARKIEARFPDGGFDCETIFVWEGKLYLVTKPWDGSLPRVYRLDDTRDGGVTRFLGNIPVYTMITGGDISPDGRRIALSSYRALLIFEGDGPPETLLESKPLICPLNARQVEGISWREDELILTNEQREIFHVSRSKWEEERAPFLKSPKETVPFIHQKPPVEEALKRWSKGAWLEVEAGKRRMKIGRVAWSSAGLHFGIDLPSDVDLPALGAKAGTDPDDWFQPGSVYLMINPDGARPLSYGKNDRCIRLGRSPEGQLTAHIHYLRPATFIAWSEVMPEWVRIEKEGQRLLVTLTSRAPGLEVLQEERKLGFNLLMIRKDGELLSWAPLTQAYSWDSPSIWGLLELQR